jgi:hypothetical protein
LKATNRASGERRRADCEALAGGGGGVADRVESVRDLAHILGQLRHLGDTSGIVRYRTRGIEGHRHAGGGEHADRRYGDTEQSGGLISDQGSAGDQQQRHGTVLETDRDAGDDIGRGSRLRCIDDAEYRF